MSGGLILNDQYLECDDCNKVFKGDCPRHGPLLWIKDTAVRSRARASLPAGLYLMPSALGHGRLGVFAKNEIERRVIFGPYEGKLIPLLGSNFAMDKMYTWDILRDNEVEHLIDGRDEQHSNWMRFVNCARQEQEQNVVAFQYHGEIYFRTTRPIEPGMELLVWFHDKYCWRLKDVAFCMATEKGINFRCDICGLFFAGPSYLYKHKKFRCRASSVPRASDPINDVTTLCHSEKVTCLVGQTGQTGQTGQGLEQRNVIIQSAMFVTHQGTQTDEDVLEAVLQNENSIPLGEDFLAPSPQLSSPSAPSTPVLSPTIQSVSSQGPQASVSPDFQPLGSNVTYIIENRASDGQEGNVVIRKGVLSPTQAHPSTVHCPDTSAAPTSEGPRLGVVYHSVDPQLAPQLQAPPRPLVRVRVPSSGPVENNGPIVSPSTEHNPTFVQAPPQISPSQPAPSQNGPTVRPEVPPQPQVTYVAGGPAAPALPQIRSVKSTAPMTTGPRVALVPNGPRAVNPTPVFVSPTSSATPIRISDQVVRNIINTILPLRQGHHFLPRAPGQTVAVRASVPNSTAAHVRQVQVPAQLTRSVAGAAPVTLTVTPVVTKQVNAVHSGMPAAAPTKPVRRASGGQAVEQVGESGEVKKTYPCEYCGKVFKYVSKLKEHEPTHTGEKPFQCKHCSKCFTQKGTLKDHLRLHSGEKPFKCDVCGESFTWKIQLRVHRSTHTGDEPYKCELCDKAFAVKQYLTVHQRSHPGHEKPFKCDVCEQAFTQKVHLAAHKRGHAGDDLKCPDCNKCFTQREHLDTHRRLHTGEKPYKCDECGECFAVNSDLILHSRKHTDDRPTRCPDCGKGFSRMAALAMHRRIHSGEKPFKCNDCGKRFISNSRLMVHQRWHSGAPAEHLAMKNGQLSADEKKTVEAARKCSECNRCFADDAALAEHQRSHAPKKTEVEPMNVEPTNVEPTNVEPMNAEPALNGTVTCAKEPPALGGTQAEPPSLQKTSAADGEVGNQTKETPMEVDGTAVPPEAAAQGKSRSSPVSAGGNPESSNAGARNDPAANGETAGQSEQTPATSSARKLAPSVPTPERGASVQSLPGEASSVGTGDQGTRGEQPAVKGEGDKYGNSCQFAHLNANKSDTPAK